MAFRRSNVPGEDIRRGMEMVQKRRQLIEETPAGPLVYEYGVNRLAKSLHPGMIRARITNRTELGKDLYLLTFGSLREDGRFPFFRAGQFITLSKQVGPSFLSRPYSIVSSPMEAMKGKLEIIVQRKGIFSSYLIDDAVVGEEIAISEPSGDFYHDDLRDPDHIAAIAGGSGITPFLSMMRAIHEGSEEFSLTLFYGIRSLDRLPFDPKEYEDEKIRIVIVLSEEEAEGYRHGFIDADLLKKELPEDCKIFMCGPDAMYEHVGKQLQMIGFDPSRIRRERNSIGDRKCEDIKAYVLKIRIRDEMFRISAFNNETIVTAMERAGIKAPVRCKSGVCGFCHSRVISGEYLVDSEDDFRRAADRKFNYIHPCCTYPLSDMVIEVPIFEIPEDQL